MITSANASQHQELAQLLRIQREALGLDQRAVAALLGRPQSFVSHYETGQRRLDVIEFLQLCALLQLDPLRVVTTIVKIMSNLPPIRVCDHSDAAGRALSPAP